MDVVRQWDDLATPPHFRSRWAKTESHIPASEGNVYTGQSLVLSSCWPGSWCALILTPPRCACSSFSFMRIKNSHHLLNAYHVPDTELSPLGIFNSHGALNYTPLLSRFCKRRNLSAQKHEQVVQDSITSQE